MMIDKRAILSRVYLPWLGLLLPLLMTLTAWLVVRRTEQRRINERFMAESQVIRDRIVARIGVHEQLLLAATEFISNDRGMPTRRQWKRYVQSLDLNRLNPGVQALGYAEWIPLSGVKAHVARVRAEGFPDYEVRPGGPLPADGGLSSIVFVEPFDARNQRAFSRDMLAEVTRREAMTQSRDLDQVILSRKVKLFQESGDKVQAGVLMFAPVYGADLPLETVAERREALLGWAYMAFRMDDLLVGILGNSHRQGIHLELFDGDLELAEARLYVNHDSGEGEHSELAVRFRFQVAGRTWTLKSTPDLDYSVGWGGDSHVSLFLAGAFTGLGMFLLLRFLLRSERQATRLADERLEKLQTLLDSTGEAIYGLDLNGNGTFFNPACLKMLGYASDAPLLGKNIHQLIHHTRPDGSPYPVAECSLFHAFRAGVEVHVAEEVFWRADGSPFPVECWSYPQRSRGKLVGAVVTFLDISARKEVESELKLSTERLALATRAGGVGVWDLDVVQNTLRWDEQMYRLHGITSESFSGVYEAWRASLHPDDAARCDAENQQALLGEKPLDTEFRVLWPDGSIHVIRALAMVQRDASGRPLRMIGTNWDITAQKAAEQQIKDSEARFRLAFENSPSAMSLTRVEDGVILQINEAWSQLFGWSCEEASGRSLMDLGIYVDLEDRHQLRLAMEAQGRLTNWSQSAMGRDGHLIHLRMGVAQIQHYEQPCFLSVLADHTALQEAEIALLALNHTLEARVTEELEGRLAHERALVHQSRLAAMGEMVGNIAHQWRQPLNALSMVLANLHDAHRFKDLTDERFAASMSQGGALIQRMSTTITDFLDFFRPAKEAVPFSVRQQVLDAIQLVAPSLGHHHVAVALLEGPEVIAMGFPNELSQVILNLLANARDAIQDTPGLSGLIQIEVSREGDNALLRVSDNGGGIPVTPLERIFEPYFTSKDTGTGLGLYMSKVILEQGMKGTITARNIPGGAEFSLTIPLAEDVHVVQ
jgi:PAS domain S-box-containing protein